MITFWIVVTVAFLAMEAATVGLVSVWFAIGSAAALIAAALRANFWVQIVVFLAVSGIALAALRPLARRCLHVRQKPTNADRVLGIICPVTEEIDNIHGSGAVSAGGKEWTARSMSGAVIPVGQYVRVASIQGVKLLVEEVKMPAQTDA